MTNFSDKEKYLKIYKGEVADAYEARIGEGYGRGNWGENIVDHIKTLNIFSVLDVGCGYGNFCHSISPYVETIYGCDIASVETGNIRENPKVTYINAESHNIPLEDGAVECITCFDVLEHVLPENIDATFQEFKRIATDYWIFCISYVPDSGLGFTFHMTVNPESWWLEKISKYAEVELVPAGADRPPYMVCKLHK